MHPACNPTRPACNLTPSLQPYVCVQVLCLGLVVLLLMRCGCRGRGPPAELPPDHPYHSLPERVLTPKKKEDKKKEEEDFDLFEDVGGVR